MKNKFLDNNGTIKEAIKIYHQENSPENIIKVFEAMIECMRVDGHFLVPINVVDAPDEKTQFSMRTVDTDLGAYQVLFTDEEELKKGPETAILSHFAESMFELFLENESYKGIVINPWNEPFFLGSSILRLLIVVKQLREMMKSYVQKGDVAWEEYGRSKRELAEIYSKHLDCLEDLHNFLDTEIFYWEVNGLYKDLFVSFFLDTKNDVIYQVTAHGENYALEKGSMEWKPVENIDDANLQSINRDIAEALEDEWNLWVEDFAERIIDLYSSDSRSIQLKIVDLEFTLSCEDFGAECLKICGKNYYEYHYKLNKEQTILFYKCIRYTFGSELFLKEIMLNEFGANEGAVKFREFCDQNNIKYSFFSF